MSFEDVGSCTSSTCTTYDSLLERIPLLSRSEQRGASAVTAGLRFALIQLAVGHDKAENLTRALNLIKKAKDNGSEVIVLPECFNSPYGTKYFSEYAESVPSGHTCKLLSASAVENQIYLIGGSIPEQEGSKYYNTCTVWSPSGELLAKHRKVHLFDIDIPGGIRFKESDVLSSGQELSTFNVRDCKIGLGICYDIRFEQMARLYRNDGCNMLVYPGAFNMTTGPLHWELLQRARAVDTQSYVAGVSPARVEPSVVGDYVAYGHTMIVDPWGKVVKAAEFDEDIVYADFDIKVVEEVRKNIPTFNQRRTDIYNTIRTAENKNGDKDHLH